MALTITYQNIQILIKRIPDWGHEFVGILIKIKSTISLMNFKPLNLIGHID